MIYVMYSLPHQPLIVILKCTWVVYQAFGLGGLSGHPLGVSATLLPPAKISYKDGVDVEPRFAGTWNIPRFAKFAFPANPSNSRGGKPGNKHECNNLC